MRSSIMKLSLIITVLFAGEAIAGDNLRANRDDKRERRLAKSPKAPKKKTAPGKKLVENVKEATPWKQNVAWIATADDNAAAMARGSWWLLMTLPMLYLN